jgi:hypothetical protein
VSSDVLGWTMNAGGGRGVRGGGLEHLGGPSYMKEKTEEVWALAGFLPDTERGKRGRGGPGS